MRMCAMAMALLVTVGARAGDDVAKALAKTRELPSYAFKVYQDKTLLVEGRYQSGQPVAFVAEKIPCVKKGAVVIYQDGGKWHKSRTGTLSDPLRILGAVAKVRQAVLPHEELAHFDKAFKDGKPVDDGVRGELTLEAAKRLVSEADRPLVKRGRASLTIRDGLVRQYHFAVDVEGTRGNVEIMGTIQRTVVIDEPGAVKITLTEEQKKALE